jgi:hypothetical protein
MEYPHSLIESARGINKDNDEMKLSISSFSKIDICYVEKVLYLCASFNDSQHVL